MLLDRLIHIAGFVAIALGLLLFSANVLIVVARLAKNEKLANNLIRRIAPFAEIFRSETPVRRNGA
jgi:hypothetical protein